MNTPKATVDFESRSACSIKECGSWKYSLDASTEILCLAYRLPYWPEGRTGLYHPAFPHLDMDEGESFDDLAELFAWIDDGGLVEAHNSFFERGLWQHIFTPRFGAPLVPHDQWRCSAAKAASYALPRGLDQALAALGLTIRKDLDGAKVMKKGAKPRKPLKQEALLWARQHAPCAACSATGKHKVGRAKATPCVACAGRGWSGWVPRIPRLYHETVESLDTLFAYCRQDVLAEHALSSFLDDLSPEESTLYLLDQRMNERGFRLDKTAVRVALSLIEDESERLNGELARLTEGQVEKATQRERMKAWFLTQGLYLGDTTKETIDEWLDPRHPWRAYVTEAGLRGLDILRALGRSSTAKYDTMRQWMCPDHRVHGGLLYHGASTGRWTGAGVQPHNFTKGTIQDQEGLWALLKTESRDYILSQAPTKKGVPLYSGIMEALSHGLRGAIVPSVGYQLYVADYAAIEARVLLWLADDQEALGMFARGEDIYCAMASTIYGREILPNPHDQPPERKMGKEGILGLGYQMGASKFTERCALVGIPITQEFAKVVVDAYRTRFWRVKALWYDQEAAAVAALQGEDPVIAGPTMWLRDGRFLLCQLPSGRCLAYPDPELRERTTPWGEMKWTVTHMGIDTYTRQWTRQSLYGGLIVENITQAVSRDIMAAAMLRCERSGTYLPVLSVHDEIVAEALQGQGSVEEFVTLLTKLEPWAAGCPIAAEGWVGPRYRK